jgi:HAD superfamily phosphatase (TIGR01668 family)
MLECFYPDIYLDSAYDIDYRKMYDSGYRGIIFDIDNTLVKDNAPADERSIRLIKELTDTGFVCMVVSNNREMRVKSFCECTGMKYVFKAHKPGTSGFIRAMQMMGTDRQNTFFVGDQLLTDVCGARRTGIFTILVKPMDPHEEKQIVFKRKIEKVIFVFYRRYLRRKRGRL